MNKINNVIEQLYNNTSDNINAVMVGFKTINHQTTNQIAIVFNVNKKKPESELSRNEILPASINIDGTEYITDVVEDTSKIQLCTCYTNYRSNAEILRLQGNPLLLTPLKGGQEIIQFPTNWNISSDGTYSVIVGTLGLIVVDNEDNRVVGLTNAHVVCYNFVTNSERQDYQDTYNLYEEIIWADENKYAPGAVCRDGLGSLVLASPYIKRYNPYTKNSINYVDAALIGFQPNIIDNINLIDNNSYQIYQPTYIDQTFGYLSFASTTEINALLNNSSVKLYSTGRSTGPKGWGDSSSCHLIVDGLSATSALDIQDGPNAGSYTFGDMIRYRYADKSNFPIAPGDSGSILLANINNQIKVIGLCFAGNVGTFDNPESGTHYGFACRIDRVAQILNIRSWDSSYILNKSMPQAEIITTNFNSNNTDSLTKTVSGVNGSTKYYNIGLTKSNNYPIV